MNTERLRNRALGWLLVGLATIIAAALLIGLGAAALAFVALCSGIVASTLTGEADCLDRHR